MAGTINIGGAPEQAATDGKGRIYVDVEDKDNVAVIDTKTMAVIGHYDVAGKGGTCAGLAMDAKNNVLFVACRNPANMVILNALDGKVITVIPIQAGTDGAGFSPATMEAFSSAGDGTVSIVKENSPTSFVAERVVQTMPGAKTMTIAWPSAFTAGPARSAPIRMPTWLLVGPGRTEHKATASENVASSSQPARSTNSVRK